MQHSGVGFGVSGASYVQTPGYAQGPVAMPPAYGYPIYANPYATVLPQGSVPMVSGGAAYPASYLPPQPFYGHPSAVQHTQPEVKAVRNPIDEMFGTKKRNAPQATQTPTSTLTSAPQPPQALQGSELEWGDFSSATPEPVVADNHYNGSPSGSLGLTPFNVGHAPAFITTTPTPPIPTNNIVPDPTTLFSAPHVSAPSNQMSGMELGGGTKGDEVFLSPQYNTTQNSATQQNNFNHTNNINETKSTTTAQHSVLYHPEELLQASTISSHPPSAAEVPKQESKPKVGDDALSSMMQKYASLELHKRTLGESTHNAPAKEVHHHPPPLAPVVLAGANPQNSKQSRKAFNWNEMGSYEELFSTLSVQPSAAPSITGGNPPAEEDDFGDFVRPAQNGPAPGAPVLSQPAHFSDMGAMSGPTFASPPTSMFPYVAGPLGPLAGGSASSLPSTLSGGPGFGLPSSQPQPGYPHFVLGMGGVEHLPDQSRVTSSPSFAQSSIPAPLSGRELHPDTVSATNEGNQFHPHAHMYGLQNFSGDLKAEQQQSPLPSSPMSSLLSPQMLGPTFGNLYQSPSMLPLAPGQEFSSGFSHFEGGRLEAQHQQTEASQALHAGLPSFSPVIPSADPPDQSAVQPVYGTHVHAPLPGENPLLQSHVGLPPSMFPSLPGFGGTSHGNPMAGPNLSFSLPVHPLAIPDPSHLMSSTHPLGLNSNGDAGESFGEFVQAELQTVSPPARNDSADEFSEFVSAPMGQPPVALSMPLGEAQSGFSLPIFEPSLREKQTEVIHPPSSSLRTSPQWIPNEHKPCIMVDKSLLEKLIEQERLQEAALCSKHLQAQKDVADKEALCNKLREAGKLTDLLEVSQQLNACREHLQSEEVINIWKQPRSASPFTGMKTTAELVLCLSSIGLQPATFQARFPELVEDIAKRDIDKAVRLQRKMNAWCQSLVELVKSRESRFPEWRGALHQVRMHIKEVRHFLEKLLALATAREIMDKALSSDRMTTSLQGLGKMREVSRRIASTVASCPPHLSGGFHGTQEGVLAVQKSWRRLQEVASMLGVERLLTPGSSGPSDSASGEDNDILTPVRLCAFCLQHIHHTPTQWQGKQTLTMHRECKNFYSYLHPRKDQAAK